jgi:hypothetical protein
MTRTANGTANPINDIQARVNRAALHASPAIAALARMGFAAKGVVYVLVGGLALLAAVGSRLPFHTPEGATTGSRGALRTLLDQPYGKAMLIAVAIGLAGYALWCFVRAVLDPGRDGKDFKGIAKRAGNVGKGVIHVALVMAVVRMLRGSGSAGDDGQGARDWTAWLMSFPMGQWLVALVGLGVVGYGGRQIYRAWVSKMDDPLNLGRMGPGGRAWTVRLSRFGMAARGVVFGIIGMFLVVAAYRANPREVKGVGEALATLERQPYGPVLLAVVALGLVSYGVFQFILARYRRIEAP